MPVEVGISERNVDKRSTLRPKKGEERSREAASDKERFNREELTKIS